MCVCISVHVIYIIYHGEEVYMVNIQPETEVRGSSAWVYRCKLPMTEVEGCMFTIIQLAQHDTYDILYSCSVHVL